MSLEQPMISRGMSLLPTDGIKDRQVRNFLDRLVEAWDERNDGDDRFVSRKEFSKLAGDAVLGAIGGGNGQDTGANQLGAAIENLQEAIRNSLLYQILESTVQPVDLEALRSRVDGALQYALAGLSTETTIRYTDTYALAAAINRIWGYVGGATAVIESGSVAGATPSAATATKWNSVIAAVTDPNTGLVNAASIVEELDTYANSANSTFNAIYTVKAQISSGSQTIVGGFGLAATSGAGSAEGPTIDFGVRADKFYIAGTSSTPSLTDQLSGAAEIPFIVVTSTQTIGGITYNPGVYMKTAFIVDATITNAKIANAAITTAKIADANITTAKIGDAQITNAKIGSLAVDTLNLAGQAVTIPVAAFTAGSIAGAVAVQTLQTAAITSTGAPILINVGCFFEGTTGSTSGSGTIYLKRNGVTLLSNAYYAPEDVPTYVAFPMYQDTPGVGAWTYTLEADTPNGAGAFTVRGISLLEVKK